MSSLGKPVAALAAVIAALAVAAPAASAAPAPGVDPQVCQLFTMTMGPYGPTQALGGASLGTVLANAGATVGCKAPTAQPSPSPFLP
jgi:hypothetical protein